MESTELIALLKERDFRAYEVLVDQFQQKVFSTCISFVPNKEDAEDITQEVFMEIYKSISTFKGNAKLSTWIYRVTTNKCLEFIRKKNTKKRFAFLQSISGNMVPLDQTNYFTEINHPGIQLENKELNATLFKAINSLPDQQRIAFTLHKIDGKSYQEIAEIIDKSISSVESLLFRAKKNLQKLLENYYKNHR